MKTPSRDLYNIYLDPGSYFMYIDNVKLDLGTCIFRNDSFREYFEFRFERSNGELISMIIPLSDNFDVHFRGVYDEIYRANTTLFGEFSYSEQLVFKKSTLNDRGRRRRGRGSDSEFLVNMAMHTFSSASMFTNLAASSFFSRDNILALYGAIDTMDRYLSHRFVQLGNLTQHDFAVGDDGMIYICNAVGVVLSYKPNNERSMSKLRSWVEYLRGVSIPDSYPDNGWTYDYIHTLYPGHLDVDVFFQQRARVENESGYGFIDFDNKLVVDAIYDWCSIYREGRSVVCKGGYWGMIDLYGKVVIECENDEVILLDSCSVAAVRRGDQWAYFSYTGRPCTPFAQRVVDHTLRDYDLRTLDDYIFEEDVK